MNKRDLQADMLLPSDGESQTTRQVAPRTSRPLHTASASCLARILGRWAKISALIFFYSVMWSMCHFAGGIENPK